MNHLKHRSNESIEDYLETILTLQKKLGQVRSIDIANEMNFSKPSVSRALSLLKSGGYVTTDENGYLSLTETGCEIAAGIYERHRLLTDWLIRLGVDAQTASADACKMEHHISDATFTAIKQHIDKYASAK